MTARGARRPRDIQDGAVVVLRPLQSAIAFWAICGICAVFAVDAALRPRPWLTVRLVVVMALVVWAAWALLYRMGIRLDRDGMRVRNLLRIADVPWARVVDIRRRLQLRVELDDGTAVECWGSPFAPRPGARRAADPRAAGTRKWSGAAAGTVGAPGPRMPDRAPAPDPALDTLRAAWHAAAHADDTPVRHMWDGVSLVVGAILVVAAAICLVLP